MSTIKTQKPKQARELAKLREQLEQYSDEALEVFRWRMRWRAQARKKQLPAEDHSWDFFGIKSGRGFGKTLAAANWLGIEAACDPNSYNFVIAPTHEDLIKYCFNGPSGLLAVIPKRLIKSWKVSPYPIITFFNGAVIMGFSAEKPDRLRGPQCHRAWLDECACLIPGTLVHTSAGEVPIEHIKPGDFVWTRKGLRRVLAGGLSSPSAPLWELRTKVGAVLVGTGHHPIWNEREHRYVPLMEMAPGDTLLSWPTLSFGTESGGTGGPTTTRTAKGSSCIERFTRNIADVYRRVTRYTTETTTGVIGGLVTWLCSQAVTTRRNILAGSLNGVKDRPQNNVDLSGVTESPAELRVLLAESPMSQLGSGLNSVACTAVTTCQEQQNDVVDTVRELQVNGPVYNLDVEDAHEFYANGVLTHNSWRYPEDAWDNLIFGMRLGDHPQIFWTGTPKPKPFVRMLVNMPRGIVVSGSTYENAENLSDVLYENIAKYEGTKIGRQEIYGEVIDPEEAGFIKRSQFRLWRSPKLPKFRFIVLSLDTAFTEETWDKKDQTGDPAAGSVWGLFSHEGKEHVMLLNCWEDYLGFPELIQRVKEERIKTYGDADEPVYRPALISRAQRPRHQGRPPDMVLLEDKGSGISLRQMLAVENVLTEPYNPGDLDKLSRLHAISPLFPHGRIWVLESLHPKRKGQPRDWCEPMISQLCTYVGEGSLKHDDLLDTATQALLLLMHKFNIKFTVRPDAQAATAAAQAKLNRANRRNPYDGFGTTKRKAA